jgi:hypothetical protein
MENYHERAVRRAVAIRQYRFLCKLEKLAREKGLYLAASEYRTDAIKLKERYAL